MFIFTGISVAVVVVTYFSTPVLLFVGGGFLMFFLFFPIFSLLTQSLSQVAAKADPNVPTFWHQRTPLHFAALSENAALVSLIARHCNSIDALDSDGRAPL